MKKKLIAGITVTMFLVTMITVALPARVSAQWWVGTIKIGIVGPKGWIQWDGVWEGANLGKNLINKEGYFKDWPGQQGIQGPDGLYRMELIDIDEHSAPNPDPAAGIAEMLIKLDAHPDMYILEGGFLDEVVIPIEEVVLDYAAVNKRPIWNVAGASADAIMEPLKTDRERYKYMFRSTPMNDTTLLYQYAALLKQIIFPKMASLYGSPVKFFIIADDLGWNDLMVQQMRDPVRGPELLGPHADYVGHTRPSAIATDFASDFDQAEAKGAKLVIHLFAVVAGANFMKQYGAEKRSFACVGINVESQMQEFYASIAGACEYESFLSALGTQEGLTKEESLNPDAKPLTTTEFWAIYKEMWGHAPIYNAWAAYDDLIGLNETSYDNDISHDVADPDFDSYQKGWMVHYKDAIAAATATAKEIAVNKMIEHRETLGVSDGYGWKRIKFHGEWFRPVAQGLFKYAGPDGYYHDVYSTSDCLSPIWEFPPSLKTGIARAHTVQWQAGRMEVIFPRDQLFSRKWILPSWMYTLETDFAGPTLINTTIPTDGGWWNYTAPNGKVDPYELAALSEVWFSEPHWTLLEADMQPYDDFIDVYDASKVGKDWGKSEVPK